MARPEDSENRPSGVENGEEEQKYRYVSTTEVRKAFEHFGYGPSKRYVDALYISEDGKKAVGVLKVTEEQCKDHFEGQPVLRGVDQIEALGQTYLLSQYLQGRIPKNLGPLFAEVDKVHFKNPARPGAVLNMHVEEIPTDKTSGNVFSARGRIMSGEVLISEIESFSGALLPIALLPRLMDRSARQQASTSSPFQIQG